MKKTLLLFALIFSTVIFSQQKSEFWKHVRFGGGFGMSFGGSTNILISPSTVYDFKNGFSLGAGLNYQYSENGALTTNIYGISAISLYNIPVIGIQLSGEFEQLFASQTNGGGPAIKTNFPAMYVGAAYQQGRFSFGFRYDLLYNNNKSIYASAITPIVRFYF